MHSQSQRGSDNRPPLGLTTLVLLLSLSNPASAAETTQPNEMCLSHKYRPPKPQNVPPENFLFEADNSTWINLAVDYYKQHNIDVNRILQTQTGPFRNTVLHLHLANHKYDTSIEFLRLEEAHPNRNPQEKTLRERQDANGCTPLALHCKMAGPTAIAKTLISPKSVMIPDNYGITPLMYAVRGMDPSVTEAILHAIGDDRLEEALGAKDNAGHTVDDWANMKPERLGKLLQTVHVDPTKAANSCFDTLFSLSDFQIFANSALDPLINSGLLETGITYTDKFNHTTGLTTEHAYSAIKATPKNARTLIQLSTEQTQGAERTRRITYAQSVTFTGRYDEDPNKGCHKFWKKVNKESARLLKGGLSEQSLIQFQISNQPANKALLQHAKNRVHSRKRQSLRRSRIREL